MSDLISRQAAIDAIENTDCKITSSEWDELVGAIMSLPSPKGQWIRYGKDDDVYDLKGVHTWGVEYQCPFCGQIHTLIEDFGQWHFCPECGTKMEVEHDS